MPPQRSPGLGVLIVNDDPELQDEMAVLLRRQGLDVHVVGTALEARTTLLRHPGIGVLVADVTLLEGAGLLLAAEIIGGRPSLLPIELVLLTGYGEDREPPEGTLLQDIGLVREPMRPRDITAAVEVALCRALARRNPDLDHLSGSSNH